MGRQLRVAGSIFGIWLGFFLLARAGFYLSSEEVRGLSLRALAAAFTAGLRLDLSGAAYLTAPAIIALAVAAFAPLRAPGRAALAAWLGTASVAAALLVVADVEIFRHWGRRIDASVLPYLATPAEAWASAGASPRLGLLAVSAAIAALLIAAFRQATREGPGAQRSAVLPRMLSAAALLVALVPIARGGLGTWPLTTSSAYHSADTRANWLAENAIWGFFDSVYRRFYDRSNPYARLTAATADSALRAARAPAGPRRPSPFTVSRPNLVLVVWESASARAVRSIGGVLNGTPAFDSLASAGMLFSRFYASGDRTDKGVAALLSGFPGIPRGAITTTPSKSRHLPSLPAALGRLGYHSAFFYGGELEFAGLQGYLTNTGFDRRIGKGAFPRSSWNSKWGAHDSVVAERLLADLDSMPRPFLAVWLTLSSHEPFEVPGVTPSRDESWQTQYSRALQYTDRVIARLIGRLSERSWWKETVVVVVGDHGRRIRPLDSAAPARDPETEFRIPMLWLGGALRVRDSVVDEPASQLDLTPTLLDAIGGEAGGSAGFGRSLLIPVGTPFGYFGFNEGFGLVTDRAVLVRDDRGGRDLVVRGPVGALERSLGRALLQTSYQSYLDR